MPKHRRIQDGGNPAQGPEVDEPITPSTDDDFPDTPPETDQSLHRATALRR